MCSVGVVPVGWRGSGVGIRDGDLTAIDEALALLSACADEADVLGQSRGPMHGRRNTTHQNDPTPAPDSASSKRSQLVIPRGVGLTPSVEINGRPCFQS